MAMMTLPSGGITDRRACGMTTLPNDWPNVRPTARAASACPAGTALMPDLTASQTNAAV